MRIYLYFSSLHLHLLNNLGLSDFPEIYERYFLFIGLSVLSDDDQNTYLVSSYYFTKIPTIASAIEKPNTPLGLFLLVIDLSPSCSRQTFSGGGHYVTNSPGTRQVYLAPLAFLVGTPIRMYQPKVVHISVR